MKRTAVILACQFVVVTCLGCGDDSSGPPPPPPPPQAWQKSAGGTGDDFGLGVTVDGSGNVIVSGQFEATANFSGSVTSAGGADAFVAKYNAGGSSLWVKSGGGTGEDTGWGVATDGSGNVFLTGYFQGTATFEGTMITSAGSDDIYLAKYDGAGNLLWIQAAGGTGIDRARGITTDGSGNVIVTGRFEGTADFGGTMLTSAGADDIVIAKYDTAGNLVWAQSAGGTGVDQGWGVATDGSEDVVVTGYYTGTATFGGVGLTGAGLKDVFVVKYTSTGALVWAQSAGGTGDDQGWDIGVDGSNNVVLTGSFETSATFGASALTSAGGKDGFVAKYSSAGNVVWAQSAGGTTDDEGLGIAIDGSGNVVVIGFFNGTADFSGVTLTAAGGPDIFTARYNPSGALFWAQSAGGIGLDGGFDNAADATGNILWTGRYQLVASFGSKMLTSVRGDDVFVVRSGPNGLQ